MSNTRIDSPAGRVPNTTSTQSAGDIASTSSAENGAPSNAETLPQSDSKTASAFKQRGNEVKSQQHITARVIKHELEQHLGNVPTKTITVERDAGNDKLAKIHVHREVQTTPPKQNYVKEYVGHKKDPIVLPSSIESGKETSTTRFPNGVGIKTDSYIDGDGSQGVTGVSVQPPPGGKVIQTRDGGSEIYDKEGKKVGEFQTQIGDHGMKFALTVHTKEGTYVQNEEGQIKFTPNRK
jgi:hypothetical protein